MTVEAQTPFNEHTGNGVTTTFGYTFQLLDADDLKVYVDGSLVNAADYTVNGVGVAAGGDVEFDTAPEDGADVLLSRELPLTRETNYATLGDLRAGTVNQDFDRLWQLAQQQEAQRGGMLRAPYPEQLDDLPASASRANKALVFDADGNPTVSEDDYDDQLADVTAQATIATTQAGIATTKASEAATSATNAEASRDAIDNRIYPGSYSAAPSTRPDGSAIQDGDEYFNDTANLRYRWNGSSWVASDINTANLAAPTGASLVGLEASTLAVLERIQDSAGDFA